jgi:hypothetical protein
LGHAPAAALTGFAETAVGAAAAGLGWSLHPAARMSNRNAANPIAELLCLRIMFIVFSSISETNVGRARTQ